MARGAYVVVLQKHDPGPDFGIAGKVDDLANQVLPCVVVRVSFACE
jgi:hypothetical protein